MKNATRLVKFLQTNKLTVAFAESVTCGLACHQLTNVIGTSKVLLGGGVSYQEKVKTDLLKVSPTLIKKYTAESQQVTVAMAMCLQKS